MLIKIAPSAENFFHHFSFVWMGSCSTFMLHCHCFVVSVTVSLSTWKGHVSWLKGLFGTSHPRGSYFRLVYKGAFAVLVCHGTRMPKKWSGQNWTGGPVLPPLLPVNHVAQCSELIYWQHKYSAGMIIQAIVNVF